MLGVCKRTSDSRGLHPSASPPHPPFRPPPPPPPLWHFVQRRRKGGETAEEETEGTLRQHVPRQSQTARELSFWRPRWKRWGETATLLLLGKLRYAGRPQRMMSLDSCAQWRFISATFLSSIRWWCRLIVPALTGGQPNECEGGLSALFPAPLYVGFPAVMSAIYRCLFVGKSLPIPFLLMWEAVDGLSEDVGDGESVIPRPVTIVYRLFVLGR